MHAHPLLIIIMATVMVIATITTTTKGTRTLMTIVTMITTMGMKLRPGVMRTRRSPRS